MKKGSETYFKTLIQNDRDEEFFVGLRSHLIRHEGYISNVYRCSLGYPTIGVGHLLSTNKNANFDYEYSVEDIERILLKDIKRSVKDAMKWVGVQCWVKLCDVRRMAVVNFVFNVGLGTARKFKNSLRILQSGDYEKAADNMLKSRWAKQVGRRSKEVTDMIRTGTVGF